jgi:hypothetical protein
MEKGKKNGYKVSPSGLTELTCHAYCGQTPRANVGENSPELLYEVLKYKLAIKQQLAKKKRLSETRLQMV